MYEPLRRGGATGLPRVTPSRQSAEANQAGSAAPVPRVVAHPGLGCRTATDGHMGSGLTSW